MTLWLVTVVTAVPVAVNRYKVSELPVRNGEYVVFAPDEPPGAGTVFIAINAIRTMEVRPVTERG